MRAKSVQHQLMKSFRAKSKHEPRRWWLGMSRAGSCPLAWYRSVVDPDHMTSVEQDRMSWYSLVGYALEAAIVIHLGGKQVSKTLVAKFDKRFVGHTDHELPDGTVLDVKTTTYKNYNSLSRTRKGAPANVAQLQAYMRHGEYEHGILLYTPREIPYRDWGRVHPLPFLCIDVPRDEQLMDEIDEKARRVLRAFELNEPPLCTCGRCIRR